LPLKSGKGDTCGNLIIIVLESKYNVGRGGNFTFPIKFFEVCPSKKGYNKYIKELVTENRRNTAIGGQLFVKNNMQAGRRGKR